MQQGKGRKSLAWRRGSWKGSRIWKDKMCIYFLLLSWALVLLFEVDYLHLPPVSLERRTEDFCLLKQPHQAPLGRASPGQGEGQPAKIPCPLSQSTCVLCTGVPVQNTSQEVRMRWKSITAACSDQREIRDHSVGFPHQGYPHSNSLGFIGHGGINLQREASASLPHWLNQSLSTWSRRICSKSWLFLAYSVSTCG